VVLLLTPTLAVRVARTAFTGSPSREVAATARASVAVLGTKAREGQLRWSRADDRSLDVSGMTEHVYRWEQRTSVGDSSNVTADIVSAHWLYLVSCTGVSVGMPYVGSACQRVLSSLSPVPPT
jgi:hypothetical protein